MDRRGSRTEALETGSARHHDGDGPERGEHFLLRERVFYLLACAIQAGLGLVNLALVFCALVSRGLAGSFFDLTGEVVDLVADLV